MTSRVLLDDLIDARVNRFTINVMDAPYNAVGNGSTNDTAAIQAAIDAASTAASTTKGMVTVLIPGGRRFLIVPGVSTVVTIDNNGQKYALLMKPGVHLRIDGEIYCPFVGNPATFGNWQAAIAGNTSSVKCAITGTGRLVGGAVLNDTDILHGGILFCGSSNFRVDGVEVVGFRGDHIRCDRNGSAGTRPSLFWINNCYVHDGVGQGIEINGALRFRVTNNLVEAQINAGVGGGAEAIWLNTCDEFVITGNTSGRDYGTALSMVSMLKGTISGNHFSHDIGWTGTATDVSITGNVATRIFNNASAAETRVTISGNVVNGAANSIQVGGTGATGLVVANNTCNNAITVIAGTGATVSGNSCTALDIRAAKTSVVGNTSAWLNQAGTDCAVTGNYIEAVASTAVDLSAARCILTGNYIKGGSGYAIRLTGTVDNGVIADNILSSSANVIRNDSSSATGLVVRTNTVLAGTYFGVVPRDAINFSGTGSPESVITAAIGSTYARTDGGTATSFYVKESGSGNTGWVAK